MKHSQQFLKRRKFLMVLPLLVLPFLTMIFWALGGGQGTPVQAKSLNNGLNFELPDAHFQDKEIWNKLSLYEMAERDSAKFEEARESDPYFDLITFQEALAQQPIEDNINQDNLIDTFPHKDRLAVDPNEERVNNKLEELYREINKPVVKPQTVEQEVVVQTSDPQFSSDVEKLEQMMEMMNDNGTSDPEMQQIESMLDKILDVQHPERVKEKLKVQSEQSKQHVYAVEASNESGNISLLANEKTETAQLGNEYSMNSVISGASPQNAFYGLDDEVIRNQPEENAIEAVIHDTQEVVAGATVKMRLLDDIFINSKLIPKDQLIYGVCAINGERLTIEIGSIRTGNYLLPVSLTVYDLDGMEGIYIPGAISRDAAKQTSDEAIQNMQLMTMDPSIGAQAASAGIEATKGLLSKKAKLIKVTVKAGYKILLKDTKLNNQ
ncbi:MAG: conjugative transposon protein TraM [Cyclobacteriaceae bacterium]